MSLYSGTRKIINREKFPWFIQSTPTQNVLELDTSSYVLSNYHHTIPTITFEVWMYNYTESANFGFGAHPDAGGGNERLYMRRNLIYGYGQDWSDTVLNIEYLSWQHICLACDGSYLKIYSNFIQKASPSVTWGGDQTPNLTFGGYNYGNIYDHMYGLLFEVRIWNYEKTLDELKEDAFKRLIGNETGLLGLWRFDQGQGNRVPNLTGETEDAVIYGGRWKKIYKGPI